MKGKQITTSKYVFNMTEQEYIDATDLAKLRTIQFILNDLMLSEDPNQSRLKSIRHNVALCIEDLSEKVKINEKTANKE
jgi:hypothetical protein